MYKNFTKLFSLGVLLVLMLSLSFTAFAQDDTEPPSDVENLAGSPLNGAVSLTWDSATDDTGIAGYQVHYGQTPVEESGETYENVLDVGNVLNYTVDGLTNGTTYYFSVVAYDAAANESLSWAPEVAVTPSEDAGDLPDDSEAPQVSNAQALNVEQVKVEFSEAIILPSEFPEDAFTIENNDTLEFLDVMSVKMDEEDLSNKTVILETAQQETNVEYTLTVGSDIEDTAGNPISSGTSDTAVFTGSSLPKPTEDVLAPVLMGVEPVDNTHLMVTFDEPIYLSIDPAQNFSIVAEDDPTNTLDVVSVELADNDQGVEDSVAVITTSGQEARTYLLVVVDIEDEQGNVVNPSQTSGTFYGITDTDDTSGDDTDDDTDDDADEDPMDQLETDVADFLASKMMQAGDYVVKLSWTSLSDNSNIEKQMLYLSTNRGSSYNEEASLDPDETSYEVEGLNTGEYWFKLTQVDMAGNESEGAVTRVTLSETGPELIGLLFVSVGLGGFFRKKRK